MSKKLLVKFGLSLSALFCATGTSRAEMESATITNPAFQFAALRSSTSRGEYVLSSRRDRKLETSSEPAVSPENPEQKNFSISQPLAPLPLAYDRFGTDLSSSLPPGLLSTRSMATSSAFHGGMGWPLRNKAAFSITGYNFSDTDHPDLPKSALVRGLLEVEFAIYGKLSWSF